MTREGKGVLDFSCGKERLGERRVTILEGRFPMSGATTLEKVRNLPKDSNDHTVAEGGWPQLLVKKPLKLLFFSAAIFLSLSQLY